MATLSVEIEATALDTKEARKSISLMNAIIPDIIVRHTGRLPSLRKALTTSTTEMPATPPSSPPPPYAGPPILDELSSESSPDVSEDEFERLFGAPTLSGPTQRSLSGISTSGVRWKHVIEGCRLIKCARQEAAADDEDPELTRKMYIDAVGYLLKAMPELSAEEIAQLAQYLPASLRTSEHQRPGQPQALEARMEDHVRENNYVYRFVTIATMHGVLLVSLLLPLLERLAAVAYQYDQRYRVSNRVAEAMSQTVSSLAKRAFTSLNEGKAGAVALYTIESASRGFLDGYGRALKRQSASTEQTVIDGDE